MSVPSPPQSRPPRPRRRCPRRRAPLPALRGLARLGSLVFAVAGLLAVAPAVARASEAAERLVVDVSNGSYAGLLWLVGTAPEAESPFFAVGVARLPEVPLDRAFVLRAGDGGLEEGSAETAAEWLEPGQTVVEVQVAPMAFDLARHLIARWQEGEQAELPPEQRLENLLDRVARAAGLEIPYRSVLRGSDPAAFLRDLARINGGG